MKDHSNDVDTIRQLFQQHYGALLRHARRHIRHDELAGDLPVGALKAADIVDEVGRQVLRDARRKPPMNWRVWFYHLLHEELRRQRRRFKQKQAEEISTDETKTLPEDAEKAAGYDALRPLDIIQEELEPPVVRAETLLPDPGVAPPDEIVAEKDLLEHLQHTIRNWPRPERELFELHFVEGFEPNEVATITGQPLKTVREKIARIHARLRDQLRLEEAVT